MVGAQIPPGDPMTSLDPSQRGADLCGSNPSGRPSRCDALIRTALRPHPVLFAKRRASLVVIQRVGGGEALDSVPDGPQGELAASMCTTMVARRSRIRSVAVALQTIVRHSIARTSHPAHTRRRSTIEPGVPP